ncbi:MAG: hypothetical protein HPY72_02625 [Anaerolineae bacterium]|nr:hypothetical protein [Anaerolineae bacterium]
MWCGIVFGLVCILGGVRMLRTGEGIDLRHKRTGMVYGEQATSQAKGAITLGVFVILFSIVLMVMQNR